ncbi:hypothetical protein [Candidatus Hepatobacter penaei]|uniref:hypothetical protein n=1 Tax=Candidatus Hepatobacter penaei TaxID=1274402 RepID=UPI0004F2E017|nr:hypothetical protein [Candidatus Hepatobacter penaei]TGW15474.1 hypothetical protein EIL50_01805 [bacterium NHP-B]
MRYDFDSEKLHYPAGGHQHSVGDGWPAHFFSPVLLAPFFFVLVLRESAAAAFLRSSQESLFFFI